MTTIQQSFSFVNARFFSLLDQIQAGTLTSVSIMNTTGSSVVAKIVPAAAFDAALALGGAAVRVKVPQLPYGMTPSRLGYNGLYKLTKQLRDDNAIVESSTKSTATYTKNVTATLTSYRSGPDGLNFTAKTTGTAGNLANITVVGGGAEALLVVGNTVTVTLNTGVSTFTSVKALLDGNVNTPFTVAVVGSGATVATTLSVAFLTGGDTGSVIFQAKASGSVGNDYTITLADVGNHATTDCAIVGNDVTVSLRKVAGTLVATLAEIASAVTAASATVRMTALATGTTSLVAAASGPTSLSGGVVGAGAIFTAYDVTRTLLPSRQAGLAPSSPVRAVMIPKQLADQLGL